MPGEVLIPNQKVSSAALGPGMEPATKVCALHQEFNPWPFGGQADALTTEQHRPVLSSLFIEANVCFHDFYFRPLPLWFVLFPKKDFEPSLALLKYKMCQRHCSYRLCQLTAYTLPIGCGDLFSRPSTGFQESSTVSLAVESVNSWSKSFYTNYCIMFIREQERD